MSAATVPSPTAGLTHPGSAASPAPSASPPGSGTRPLRLRRVNHSDEIISGFGRLLKSEAMTDVTLSCEQGLNIRAHRVILSTFSPYFKAIFESQPFVDAPWHYPVVVMKDFAYHDLKAIVEFIYKGEVSVPRDKLAAVLQAARALEVSGLSDLTLDKFGVSDTASATPPPPPPLTNGAAYKRTVDADYEPSKKLRITLDNDVVSSSSFNNYFAGGMSGGGLLGPDVDGVRSLLQQPPRLPHVFQQLRQQHSLQQLALTSQKRTNVPLQQLMQQQRALQAGHNRLATSPTARHLQLQQQHLKQQILQQQLLRNAHNKTNGVGRPGPQSLQFLQFQQRIRQQFQDKQRTNLHDRLAAKPLLHKQLVKDEADKKTADVDDEVEVIIKEGDGPITVGGSEPGQSSGDSGNGDSEESGEKDDDHKSDPDKDKEKDGERENGQVEPKKEAADGEAAENGDDDEQNVPLALTREPEADDDHEQDEEEYEIEIDKDMVFQQQQQLRLQQIQKQQQYQQQLQLQLEQEEQEQRLMEYHQRLQDNQTDVDDQDNGSGFGFDWQEGFTDELPYTAQNATLNEAAGQTGRSLGDNGHPVVATPDFLQPRGPGRPRKGNKAQEISPCPECNKVFVRPDVLKLHYRSVHLNERHPCNLCPKIFKWPGDLSKHKRTKHPDKHPPANQGGG